MAAGVPSAALIAKQETTRTNIKRKKKHMAENGQKSLGRKRNIGDRQVTRGRYLVREKKNLNF